MADPRDLRKLGYSTRGNASPVGETDEPLTLPRRGDNSANQEANALRRSYDASVKAAADIAKRDENTRREVEFRAKGVKHFTDAHGMIRPEVDEQNRPRFTETSWKKSKVGDTWALARRNERGETETRKPKLTASGDLKDPNLYYDFGDEGREVAGHVDDLTKSEDADTARIAASHRLKRNAAIRNESLKPLRETFTKATVEVDSAKLQRSNLDTRISQLNEKAAALEKDPAYSEKTGLLFREPTPRAKELQAQRSALQSQIDTLSTQSNELRSKIEKGGELYARHERAKVEMDLWENQSKLDSLGDLAEQRRSILRAQGKSDKDDPILSNIVAQQQAFGMKSSEAAQRKTALEAQFQSEREKVSAEKNVATEDQLRRSAGALEERRQLVGKSFAKLRDDVAAGRIDQGTAAQAAGALMEAERDFARNAGALAGKTDALLKQRGIENARSRRTMAQGEQLYTLEKNAGSVLQRVAEGTRDKDGTQRAILSQSPSVREAAKAAAFYAGDSEYSSDLYAKLPGRQIAINPAAFTLQGHKPAGVEKALTWRDAIDHAVKSGDLDARKAEPMRRELATREMLANEAAVDATLDNDTFRRWVAKTHPDLAKINLFGWEAADYQVPHASPALRASAKEFLKAEPSAAQKVWNGLKMVGIGALNVGVDGVRSVLPDDGTGEKTLKEFSDGVAGMAMDPRLDKHWLGLIGQGVGSSLAFATPAGAAGGLAQGLGLSAKAVKWTVSGMIAATGGLSQGQAMYDEAKRAGADEEVADGARWLGNILGMSEAVPLSKIVGRAAAAKPFTFGSAVRKAVAEIGEEVIQEVGSQGGNDAVARMLYDKNREFFDSIGESATGAGGSAAILSVLASVASGVRYRRTVDLLNVAQQSREISEIQLGAALARPEVQAVSHLLPPVSQISQQFEAQRATLQQQIAAEAAKSEPSEDALLLLHEQLAQVEIGAGASARAFATRAADLSDAIAQAKAASDYLVPDPTTGQPVAQPALVDTNRFGVEALVKIAAGVPHANLTEGETQALATIGAELGSEMLREVGGVPVITDKAREWALDLAPGVSRLIRQTESEMVSLAGAAPAPKKKKGARDGKKDDAAQALPNPGATPAAVPAPAEGAPAAAAPGAAVSFTNEAGQPERISIPAGAVVPSSQAPVRDQTTAEQYLAETRNGPVRDVEFAAPNAAAEQVSAEKKAPSAPPPAVAPATLLRQLAKPLRAKGVADRDIAAAAVQISKQVNDTVASFSSLFEGRVEVTDKPSNTGGFLYDTKRDTLVVSTADLGADAESLRNKPERIRQLVREESIHRAAVQLEKSGQWQARDLWESLAPATRDSFVRAYNRGRGEADGANTTDSWAMGHETVRMLVQGRLAVQDGKLTLDGTAISEETASPSVLAKIAEVLRKIRDYFTDLAGSLQRDGNSPEATSEVRRVVELVTERLQVLESATSVAPSPKPPAPAAKIEGEKISDEWSAFAPESGTLGIPRAEMPQVKSEHRGALTQFLKARGITHAAEEVLPMALKPTQQEFSPAKVEKARGFEGPNRAILVSSDNYVVDGHHQYVAALKDAPGKPYPVIRFNAPIREVLAATREFPSVDFAEGTSQVSAAAPQVETIAAEAKAEPVESPAARSTSPESRAVGDATITPDVSTQDETPASASVRLAPERRQAIAQQLGIQPSQVGSLETVTHKGLTVETVNVVIEAEQANTSHNPDGTIRAGYPHALQPRDRSGGIYVEQQRRIAANPNWNEEMLSGTPDRGAPIMAKVGDQIVTLVGNGRANAKALMYSAPDLSKTAEEFAAEVLRRAPQKGIAPTGVIPLKHPVFARFIVDTMSLPDLRAFSQASNEFSGAATNAIEQAKVDASRMTPAVMAFFNPEFDLDASRNDEFRREFVRQVIGRSENITGPDLRRRIESALFAKAYGDTQAGTAAFSRLAGEDDEGVRNLVRAMLDVASSFAAMRQRIEGGTLYPLDLSPTLTRAVQQIAVTLREKPAKQSTDAALDGLVNQTELSISDRDPLEEELLRFLITNRRNRATLARGLSNYVAGVYAAGDPRQADMFGTEERKAVDVLRAATSEGNLGSGRGSLDPNQLEFEAITPEEIAAADRALEQATRADLVRDNIPLADKIANQFKIPGLDPDDIRQEARTTLFKAAREYDQSKGAFAPYAGTIVRNRLRDLFNKEVRRVQRTGVSTDVQNEDGTTILDSTPSEDDSRSGAEMAETRRLLIEALDALPTRLRQIIEARSNGVTHEQIATEHGLTRQRVQQLAENAMNFIRARLRQRGVRGFENGVLASGRAESYRQGNEKSAPQVDEEIQLLIAALTEDQAGGTGGVSNPAGGDDRPRSDQAPIEVSDPRSRRRVTDEEPGIVTEKTRDHTVRKFPAVPASPAQLRARSWGEIEAALMRDGAHRDAAARMLNHYLDAREGSPRRNTWDEKGNAIPIGPRNDLEASQLAAAIRVFDRGGDFEWPKNLRHLSRQLMSSSAEDDAAVEELMRELARDVPGTTIDAAVKKGSTEADGARTVGSPDLANPAGPDDASRGVMNAVDEARKETMERETHEQWRQEAVNQIARDRVGVLRDLLSKAQDGQALDNPVQVKAAQLLVNELIQKAVATKDAEAMRQAQVLAWSYREGGTDQARAFAARRDPFKRPADRYREFLAGAVFTPSPKLRKELKSAWSPAEKQRRIATLNKQLADARAEALQTTAGTVVPADVQKRIANLNRSLGEALQQKDRVELLNTSLSERSKRIEEELGKMGVTLDDIFAGEAYLRLRGAKIDNNIFDAANYSAIKRRVLALIKKGWSNENIAGKTGLNAAQVGAFEAEHISALRERLSKLGDAALDPDKLDTLNLAAAPATLSSGGGLSAEERAKKIEEMIQAMGYGRAAQREKRTRRAGPARRQGVHRKDTAEQSGAKPGQDADAPGQLPEYPEASGRTRPDLGNRQFDLEETGNEQPPGATAPATRGRRGELVNDALDARRDPGNLPEFPETSGQRTDLDARRAPGETPQFPDANGRANPYDFADEDAAPPVFDIADPVHVAQAARVIQAIDSNAFDMVSEFWINSVLSGPQTQIANLIGNTANTVWDFTFKRFGEAAVNAVVRDANAPHLAEFRHMLRAMQPALARAWRNAVRTWSAESPMFENDVLNQQLELGADFDKAGATRAAIPGRTGRVVRIPGRLLMATDDFFKTWIAHVDATAQAYRIARAEGVRGAALESRIAGLVNLPGSPAWLAAVNKAEELTFQEKHEERPAGRLLQMLSTLRDFDLGGGVKPLRFVLPFVRTPFNIFAQGFRQSPAGMALLLGRFSRAGFYRIRNGRPMGESYPRPEMIKHSVEQLMAWTTAAILYGAAAGDEDDEDKPFLITGSVPYTDPANNALNQRTANQAFTIRLGTTLIPYGRIEPAATILGTTVDMLRAIKQSRRDGAGFDAIGALMSAIGQQAQEKTFLRGITDVVGALQGARRGDRENYAAQFLSSFVPNLIRQPLRELDPYVRDRSGGFVERLTSAVVPQLAEPKVDVYGDKIERPGLAAWRAFVPVNVRQMPEVNRVDQLLTNWYQAHPEDAWAPLPLSRTVRLNQKETRQLTGAELREYSTRAGRLASQMLRNAALNVEKPTEDDIKRVQNAFSTARTITRRQMFGARAQEIDSP